MAIGLTGTTPGIYAQETSAEKKEQKSNKKDDNMAKKGQPGHTCKAEKKKEKGEKKRE